MILPQSYLVTLIVMIFGMLCMGSWAATFKLGGKWRFELYYFDFTFGVLLTTLLLAFTIGNIGFDGFSVFDDLMHAGKRQWLYGFVAGVIFNFANMLLTGAISVAGMSVAFPLGIGTAVVIGSLLSLLLRRGGNPLLMLPGCLIVMAGMVAIALAYRALGVQRHEALARAGRAKSTLRPSAMKAILLSLVSGLLMGAFAPMLQNGMAGEVGLGPYAISLVFAFGVFFSTFAYNMFFVNLPVEGDPVEIGDYFKTSLKTHLLGLSGGALWAIGSTALLVGSAVTKDLHVSYSMSYMLNQGFAVVAALWGLLVWKEFAGADTKGKLATAISLSLYIGGLFLISIAPLYVRRG